jgi:hypothetical protein
MSDREVILICAADIKIGDGGQAPTTSPSSPLPPSCPAPKCRATTARCERTGRRTPLAKGFLVADIRTGDWCFVCLDAVEYLNDYTIPITHLTKSQGALVEWLAHLSAKLWFKPEKFFEFIKRLRKDNKLYGFL